MRLQLAIIWFFLATSLVAANKSPPSWREVLHFLNLDGTPVPYSIIKDIIEGIIKNFEGEKKQYFDKIELNSGNRFEHVTVESFVPKIHLDMDDKINRINIRNLTAPIKLIQVNGEYAFEELLIPGGLTIYGNGKFKIRFEELRAFARLDMKHSTALNKWKVSDVAADASLKSFLFQFENLMNGEPLGDFLQTMISQLIPVFVELLQGLVAENKGPIMEIIAGIMNNIMGS